MDERRREGDLVPGIFPDGLEGFEKTGDAVWRAEGKGETRLGVISRTILLSRQNKQMFLISRLHTLCSAPCVFMVCFLKLLSPSEDKDAKRKHLTPSLQPHRKRQEDSKLFFCTLLGMKLTPEPQVECQFEPQ